MKFVFEADARTAAAGSWRIATQAVDLIVVPREPQEFVDKLVEPGRVLRLGGTF